MKRLLSIVMAFVLAFGLTAAPISVQPALANPGTIIVSISGDDTAGDGTVGNPYQTIQKGIDVAVISGNNVTVKAGTYEGNIVIKPGVSVTGAGANVTIIEGDGTGPVITGTNILPNEKIEGFTITGGEALRGGGIYLENWAITLISCNITGNSATLYGGGIYMTSSFTDMSPEIVNCLIKDNNAGSLGGGIFFFGSKLSPKIMNSTIADNTNGDGVYNISATTTITNTIIYGNSTNSITNSGGTVTAAYSDIEGGWSGTGNTGADPSFDSTYHPQFGSPCIDTGDNAFWGPTDLDLDGLLRIHDGDGNGSSIVDMGVYEYGSSPPSSGDTQPPTASNPDPTDGSYTADSTPEVSVELTDDDSGVDPSSVVLTVEGSPVVHSWDGSTVSYTPSVPFADGQVINMAIDASDDVGNAMAQYSWSFTISLEYTLDITIEGSGTIDLDPVGPTYPSGTQVTLTATAADGWSFTGWSGDITGSANPASITMDGDKNVTTVFTVANTPMAEFNVTRANLDFKKKPDDDKVRVQGELALDLTYGDGVDISETVTVIVGPLNETITMVEKGKKGEKWEYKRPKDGDGILKKMSIDWKEGKFDFEMYEVDLSGFTRPVSISLQVGNDIGQATVLTSRITNVTIDSKNEDDGGKVRVKGEPGFGLVCGPYDSPTDDIVVRVGSLSWTLYQEDIEVKGKEGESWEYKPPKDSDTAFRHAKVDWKKGSFDFDLDGVDLSSLDLTQPVEISVTIEGETICETVQLTQKGKKDGKWEYKS